MEITNPLEVQINDTVEVCEGSWMGRIGRVLRVPPEDEVEVFFFDNQGRERVKACTLCLIRRETR
jgi:hypothetical protein